jgi:hypothetical protein
MGNMYYNGIVEIENDDTVIEVDVKATATGYYIPGDEFGYGCNPPDEDFEIEDVEYISALSYDEEGNSTPIEITDELKKKVNDSLYAVEFEYIEPDYDY